MIDDGPPSQHAAEWRQTIGAMIPQRPDALRTPYRRSHPAMTIRCPWCHARPEVWCYRIVRRPPAQPVFGFLHPSRVEAVGMEFTPLLPPRDTAPAEPGGDYRAARAKLGAAGPEDT